MTRSALQHVAFRIYYPKRKSPCTKQPFFALPNAYILITPTHNLLSKKVFEMSTSMGMASVFVLSSLLLSPLAMAEESPAFVAQNVARAAAFEQGQAELTARHQNDAKPQQTQAEVSDSQQAKDS